MISINDFMLFVLYFLLIILVIFLIAIAYKALQTLKKVDSMLDDINDKSSKLDGVFNIIDMTTSTIVGMKSAISGAVANGINSIIGKKEKKDE